MSEERFDAVVAGTGAAGLACALALERDGFSVCLVGPGPAASDGRTAALLDGSLRILAELGVGRELEAMSAPLRRLRIIDDTASLFRPPPVEFDAAEIGLDAFGRNIENTALVALLADAARRCPSLVWRTALAAGLEGDDHGSVRLSDGSLVTGQVVVAADGRGSRLREAAGITVRDRRLPQSALTAILAHERDHGEASTELHRRNGPFTLVPLPGRRSSLVWVDTHGETSRRAALDDAGLAREIERASHGILGSVAITGARGVVPLGILRVGQLAKRRLVLVGEAGHALPPIGAQGLNLGLADVRILSARLRAERERGNGIGSPASLAAYASSRQADVELRTFAVSGLNAALLSGLPAIDAARGLGLGLLARVGPLRRAVMRAGLMGEVPRPASTRPRAGSAIGGARAR